ncbi:UNVERIFIED_CONTAM: hypothetical protein PYX00_002568 [Menopon gallinae]|uniref:La-related protein 7 n=1 Tax=Menopon gallinae TaxID=328185 RepID=A0AAW2IHI1_9NEOP
MGNDLYFDDRDSGGQKVVRRRKKQLYAAIRERMEFYFSDANLQKDRFLTRLLAKSPEVELEVFLKFNKILQLTDDVRDLTKALKKSEMLQLTEDKSRVFRTTPIKEKSNADECTIYVEHLSCDADHDWLKDIFSKFGKVDYISIPKYKSSGKIKGFAFVEFESPDAALKALEEFEKAGCCLTNQMNPEQLCSIATYEEDCKNQHSQQLSEAVTKSKSSSLPGMETEKLGSRKRKNPEKVSPDADESVPREKMLKKYSPDENVRTSEYSEVEDKFSSEAESSAERHKSNETEEESTGTKKKKNRKKKKSHKIKYVRDIQSYGLQILSKADWKRLRNKYLNIQKEKMKKLKQHLYKSQMNHCQRQQQIMETQSKPRFEFKTGLVVKVTFDEPLDDPSQVAQFKCHAKSFENIEYVDVSQGCTECYMRFNNENTVGELMESKPWENMVVLKGEEEKEYWEKMKRDRCEKFGNKKKFNSKRGRNKLINKAEKLISKRIRLSVDE